MIRAVIFDVDGTLIDSNDAHAQAWSDVFAEFGFHHSAASIRPQMGKGGDQLMPLFLPADTIEKQGEEIEKRRKQLFTDIYLPQVRAFPGVRPLFQRLHADGKQIVLASSASEKELERHKKTARIDDLVQEATSRDEVRHSKPEPDIFAAALAKLGHPEPGTVLVVGDSPFDAEAAAKLGLNTIGLLCGGFSEGTLRDAGCLAIYRDPEDLLQQYEASPLSSP